MESHYLTKTKEKNNKIEELFMSLKSCDYEFEFSKNKFTNHRMENLFIVSTLN